MQSPGAVQEAREAAESDEIDLIERIKRKDLRAFESLYRSYRPRLHRFLRRFVAESDTAEEIVNDVFFIVWKSAGTYAARSKVSTWIFGIAYRQALKAIERARNERQRRAEVNTLENDSQYAAAGPEQALIDSRWLETGLARLPAEQRLVVELTFFLGFSYQEIAAVAECPVNTVKTRMFHARRKLRDVLPKQGAARHG